LVQINFGISAGGDPPLLDSSSNPRGIFHYSDTDNTFQSKFRVPDFEALDPMQVASELMSAAANAENRRKTISGINLPLPFAGKPLNFQMTGESRSGLSFTESESKNSEQPSELSPEAREAFLTAKRICLGSSSASCDEALDTFHRLKFGESLINNDPVRSTLDSDPTASLAKMLVPALGERLEALEKDSRVHSAPEENSSSSREENDDDKDELRSTPTLPEPPPVQRRHPFSNVRYRSNRTRSRLGKIQEFLRRIS
ncbi:hypothetical protein COOONC_19653, partial [Cooperia oncophora]